MNTFNLDHLPKYKELIKQQPFVINSNFIPVHIKNVISQKEINNIINEMDSMPIEKIRVQDWGGQACFDSIILSEDIKLKITNLINKNLNEEFVLRHYSIVRYSNKYGYKAKLFPHYDTRPDEMFVFDLQLKTNEDWGIIVEGKQFNLNDNEALIFSGTQQMHWREKKDLPDSAEINMIFFWFSHKNVRPTTQAHHDIMKERESVLMHETLINSDVVINDYKK